MATKLSSIAVTIPIEHPTITGLLNNPKPPLMLPLKIIN
ncbi:uncharacterized protein G2W53_034077 [Senna tora]|uniref:Uncharacterized protein n=1 Tax=Senna tora TaxID=362788 RepID=A0A834T0P6_9FABA|nr:uncharacterized protein G2W53_034077 [Senna tora]